MFPGFLCDVSAVSQGCHKGVSRGVSSVFQVYFNGIFWISSVFQMFFKTVTRVSQESVSKVSQGLFKDYSRIFLLRIPS